MRGLEFIVIAYVIYFDRVMSPHHSHEMSQRSHVSRTSLYLLMNSKGRLFCDWLTDLQW